MVAHCSFFRSLTAFPTVCEPYCSADDRRLLILPLVNGFHDGLRAILLSGWQRYCSFFRSSTAFPTVCTPYCSVDGSALLILTLVNGFHNGLRAVLLRGWQHIADSCARQRLFRQFARRIAQRMAAGCSYFRSSMALKTGCAPYCAADGSRLLILPLVNGFHDGLRAELIDG